MPTTREASLLRRLTDRVRFYDPNAAPVYDEATHTATMGDGQVLWEGAALWQDAASSRMVVDGAQARQLTEVVIRVPTEALEYLKAGCIAQRPDEADRVQVIRVPRRTTSVTARVECREWSEHVDAVRSQP